MEEAVEATATVIHFIGDAIFADKCRELAGEASALEEAADKAGVERGELERAALLLKEASAEGRLLAVVGLRDASAALEGAACAPINALCGAAASLARCCREYRETVEGVEKMKRTIEVESSVASRGPRSLWAFLWSRRRQRDLGEHLLLADDVESGKSKFTLGDDVADTVEFIGGGASEQLRKHDAKLLGPAHEVVAAAKVARVPCGDLKSATTAFQRAGDAAGARLDLVVHLEIAASAMETAESDRLAVLRDGAAKLAHACGTLKKAADAMARVQRAAADLRRRRVAGSWWSRFRRRRGEPSGEEPQDAGAAVQPVLDKRGEEMRSAMAAFVLYGSLTLITYLGPDTVAERVKLLSPTIRICFHAGLCLWLILQAAGVPFSAYAKSVPELRCVQMLCHLGMLGVNGLTLVLAYLALGIHNKGALIFWLISASVIHFISFALAWRRANIGQ